MEALVEKAQERSIGQTNGREHGACLRPRKSPADSVPDRRGWAISSSAPHRIPFICFGRRWRGGPRCAMETCNDRKAFAHCKGAPTVVNTYERHAVGRKVERIVGLMKSGAASTSSARPPQPEGQRGLRHGSTIVLR